MSLLLKLLLQLSNLGRLELLIQLLVVDTGPRNIDIRHGATKLPAIPDTELLSIQFARIVGSRTVPEKVIVNWPPEHPFSETIKELPRPAISATKDRFSRQKPITKSVIQVVLYSLQAMMPVERDHPPLGLGIAVVTGALPEAVLFGGIAAAIHAASRGNMSDSDENTTVESPPPVTKKPQVPPALETLIDDMPSCAQPHARTLVNRKLAELSREFQFEKREDQIIQPFQSAASNTGKSSAPRNEAYFERQKRK
jgi:hypothetical protein